MESPQRLPTKPLSSAMDMESISRAENTNEDERTGPIQQTGSHVNSATSRSTHSNRELPWSHSQEWALRDYVPRHTIQIAVDGRHVKRIVRWRTLLNATPELAGYPIDFVISRYKASLNETSNLSTEILPFLDNFRFEANGGLSGLVFGVRGIQDGTRIRTDPVSRVEHSIPLGYVATEDGSVVYELGQPEETSALVGQATSLFEAQTGVSRPKWNSMEEPQRGLLGVFDPELVQLGGLTAVVLTGAWAMQTLSHHLTVNIFWV